VASVSESRLQVATIPTAFCSTLNTTQDLVGQRTGTAWRTYRISAEPFAMG
jgi:hypothetical protein